MRRVSTVVSLALLALAITAIPAIGASPSTSPEPRPQKPPGNATVVQITEDRFWPPTIEIVVGETISWHNLSPVPVVISGRDDGFEIGPIEVGEVAVLTFTRAGTYEYVSDGQAGLTGTIVVGRPDATPPPTDQPALLGARHDQAFGSVVFAGVLLAAAVGLLWLSGLRPRIRRPR